MRTVHNLDPIGYEVREDRLYKKGQQFPLCPRKFGFSVKKTDTGPVLLRCWLKSPHSQIEWLKYNQTKIPDSDFEIQFPLHALPKDDLENPMTIGELMDLMDCGSATLVLNGTYAEIQKLLLDRTDNEPISRRALQYIYQNAISRTLEDQAVNLQNETFRILDRMDRLVHSDLIDATDYTAAENLLNRLNRL